jgi:hypothetical protein
MKKEQYKNIEDYPEDWEPDWLDPSNDRKTPYTEEELKEFAQGFVESMGDTDAVKNLIQQEGMENARKIIKARFKKNDKYNLDNLDSGAASH